MSNSNEEDVEFDILKKPALEFQDECSASHDPQLHQHQEQEAESRESREEKCEAISEMGKFKVEDPEDDDEGFRTPTSLDHKIPVMKQCPPAPRKSIPIQPTKRKVSPNVLRNLQIDLSTKEIESMFPPLLADFQSKIKKARRDHVVQGS